MKRKVLMAVVAMMSMAAWAQNIAVVSPSNTTTICQTLDEAISKAVSGSVIYLPGGGFQIKDESKIDKKVTIMGVSHRADTDNADGATIISGNLNFDKNSSGSKVLGVYISGNINVGTATDSVTNLNIKYCNLNSIQVKHSQSSGMEVNQCFIRGVSNYNNANVKITNCVTNAIQNVKGGTIKYNIVLGYVEVRFSDYWSPYKIGMRAIDSSEITGNIFGTNITYDNTQYPNNIHVAPTNCIGYDNFNAAWGDRPIPLSVGLSNLFRNWNNGAISPASNFHFNDEYFEYEHKVGIYGGSSFSDETSLAPIPRIVSKSVDEQSDASGFLKVTVTVKSN
jgi:hypothetical protein